MNYKLKNIFSKRKTLYLVFGIMLVSVFTLTIVYAALNTVLKITGNAEISASSWDIKLDNVQLLSGSVTTNVPVITDNTTASFTTTLTNPGDYYMFTIDVVNNGSIDAMIDSIEKLPQLSEVQAKYLNYIVEYQNGESINTKQLVEKNSFVRLKVKVEFRKDILSTDLPTQSEILNLSFKVNYVQAEEAGTSIVPNGGKLVKIVSGDYDTVGSEICIGEECFYVISSTENDVTMLSKYNLHVGGKYDGSVWRSYGDEATGRQDLTMLGYVSGQAIRNGTTVFSFVDSVYTGSIVERYANNYKVYLESLDIIVEEVRLIKKIELEALGCSSSLFSCASSQYPWVYATSYWSETATDSNYVWYVSSNSDFDDYYKYYNDSIFGVRPVITISKSEF